jgi:hypothetical protein
MEFKKYYENKLYEYRVILLNLAAQIDIHELMGVFCRRDLSKVGFGGVDSG